MISIPQLISFTLPPSLVKRLQRCTTKICAQRIHQYLMSALAYASKKTLCQLGLFDYRTFPFVPLACLCNID
jgi:hypothetical protein